MPRPPLPSAGTGPYGNWTKRLSRTRRTSRARPSRGPRRELVTVTLTIVTVACSTILTLASPASAASARASDVDIRIVGGAASAEIVCGNVATADELARQKKIVKQRNDCTAHAGAGSATLENVDIYVTSSLDPLGQNEAALATLAAAKPPKKPDVAKDKCENHQPAPKPGKVKQVNKCKAEARAGKLTLENVRLVTSSGSQTIDAASLQSGGNGEATAVCTNIVDDPLEQRDDCTATATGAFWGLHTVDVVIRNPDGSTASRQDIDIDVRGGTATASIYCFNVIDGAGKVKQVNVCNADAIGGDVTMKNVTIIKTP